MNVIRVFAAVGIVVCTTLLACPAEATDATQRSSAAESSVPSSLNHEPGPPAADSFAPFAAMVITIGTCAALFVLTLPRPAPEVSLAFNTVSFRWSF